MKYYRLVSIKNDTTGEQIDLLWLKSKIFDQIHKTIFHRLLKKKYNQCSITWKTTLCENALLQTRHEHFINSILVDNKNAISKE